MIVVFVVDTSPSMGQPLSDGIATSSSNNSKSSSPSGSMSRLDLAKMAVESLAKGLNKRVMEHNMQLQQETVQMRNSLHNLGLGYCAQDQFLLLSTGRQYMKQPTAACGAGGRLLVGYGHSIDPGTDNVGDQPPSPQNILNHGGFDHELKRLQATVWQPPGTATAGAQPQRLPFPEEGGGAQGLNIALSSGLQLLSRYRLKARSTENFGMGRLPSPAMPTSSGGGAAVNALQPAILVLITDGECLRKPPTEGGGSLQLQFGNMPLREFYREPFRWDQRIFCFGVGAQPGISSTQYLHPSLRALCEVTGGCHTLLRSAGSLSYISNMLMQLIAPPRPRDMPIPDPIRPLPSQPPTTSSTPAGSGTFVNGGPVCCFQSLEPGASGEPPATHRAMLLNVPYKQLPPASESSVTLPKIFQSPIWCIPESFFPSKKLDTLPPRLAQPLLVYSRHYQVIGSNAFDPLQVMKALNRLDQLVLSNRQATEGTTTSGQPKTVKLLQRDVYVCEWLSQDGKVGKGPRVKREYFPVCVRGAGRPSLSEAEENLLGIGILHIPQNSSTLAGSSTPQGGGGGARLSTLTLLPPEPHVLLPLLLRAAEVEHRVIKKSTDTKDGPDSAGGATAGLIQKKAVPGSSGPRPVHLDEHWRSEFRAYMFRVPPYYQNALRRCLRPVLPASVHSLLNTDGIEALASQCFSKVCLQKIRSGEQIAKDTNERLERQEADLRRRGVQQKDPTGADNKGGPGHVGYGQYDPAVPTSRYLAVLRNLPAPWRAGLATHARGKEGGKVESKSRDGTSDTASISSGIESKPQSVVDILGDLPADCLIPYYESRRRWIFGGSGLTTRGVHVEGVNNDGSNSQYYSAKHSIDDESLLSIAGVGVSTLNKTTTVKMGDYRERLLWSRAPMVGLGSNDSTGSAATTGPDGSPSWSADDDVMPLSFFDPKTGEFNDSAQTRMRSRVFVNFGNPYKDKRGDSLIPEAYSNQRPPMKHEVDGDPHTPPGSPPHDAFSSVEGEGEAVFADISHVSPPRKHHSFLSPDLEKPKKRDADSSESMAPDSKRPRRDESDRNSPAKTTYIQHGNNVSTSDDGKSDGKTPAAPKKPSMLPRPAPPPNPPQNRKPPPPPPSRRPPPPPPAEKRPKSATLQAPMEKRPKQINKQPPPPPPPKHVQQKARPPPPPPDMQPADKKPQVDLPPGWICVWSKSQKRWYFFDTKTNKSVWQWPPPGGIPH